MLCPSRNSAQLSLVYPIKMKHIAIYIVFSLLASFTYAQEYYKVKGIILDENKRPVEYATIHIKNRNKLLQSDMNGNFFLTAYSGENLEIKVEAFGYVPQEKQVKAHKNMQLTFHLVPEVISLGEVVIQGNNERSVKMKSSQNIVQINKNYIEENFSGSLMQTLQKVPGVKAMNIGSGQSKPVIRGLGFNRMLVMENGIKHEGQQWGEEHGLEIDQFAVEDVEIIKGPGSLLYGSDAIGGVISLKNSRLPEKLMEGSVNFFVQSNNKSVGLSVRLAGRKNKFFYKAYATLIDYADYKVPTDSIQYYSYYIKLKDRRLRNTAGNEKNVSFAGGYISDKFQSIFRISDVSAKSGFFADAHGLEVRLSEIDYDKSSRDIDLPYHSVNHIKVLNNSIWQTGKIRWEGNFSYQSNIRKEFAEPVSHGYMPVPSETLERKFNKNTYSANIGMKLLLDEKHHINAGMNVEYQHNRRSGWGFIIPDFESSFLGGYVLDRYHISDRFILSGGIRFDWIKTHIHSYRDWYKTPVEGTDSVYKERSTQLNRSFHSFTWSAGVNYNTKTWNLKANIGKSFRAPIPKELGSDGVNYHIFRYEKGNPDLMPEESYQLDLGINWHNDLLDIQIDPYLNYFPNYIYMNPTADYYEGLQMYYYTQSKVIRCGFEGELNFRISRKFETDLKGEYLYAEQLSGDKKGYTLPFSPPWSSSINIKYMPYTSWSGTDGFVSATYTIVGNQNEIVPPENKTKGYQRLDVSAGRTFVWVNRQLKINLKVQNLLNTKYYDHTSYYRLIDVPEPGRNISLMVKLDF